MSRGSALLIHFEHPLAPTVIELGAVPAAARPCGGHRELTTQALVTTPQLARLGSRKHTNQEAANAVAGNPTRCSNACLRCSPSSRQIRAVARPASPSVRGVD